MIDINNSLRELTPVMIVSICYIFVFSWILTMFICSHIKTVKYKKKRIIFKNAKT